MSILGGFDLVVTCHEPYREKYLPECLAAWDNEYVAGKKILVLDSCEGSLTRNGWDVVSVKLKNPGKSRNAGLARCSLGWVVHWDADNIPRPGLANEFRNAIPKDKRYVAYIGPGVPDNHDVLTELSGRLRPGPACRVGATSAIYRERYGLDYVCAGAGPDATTWRGNLPMATTLGPLAVGAIPAGLALWRRSDYDALPTDPGTCFDLAMSRVVHDRGYQPWLAAPIT